ncbi:hypothetical protein GCM10008090_34410 [Arenicella chitinivorans]|uniref:Secreted protein n=1 Tax=Arenicella chitinivorans TaxID=1329800 RepID=A0A918S3B0_9GAMM|nr:hypothetical protein [Arenicella chitinivorans]GHA21606.1 hypothetical protein GCM10008090_34410 [Arenicella chitinivorans]
MKLVRLGVLVACLLPLSACAASDEKPKLDVAATSAPIPAAIEDVYAEMERIVGSRVCETDADCATIPLGQRACGGPSGYMAYSKLIGTDAIVQLEELAKQSAELAHQNNLKNQMMSTCDVMPPAVAACVEQRCKITTARELIRSGTPVNKDDGLIQ